MGTKLSKIFAFTFTLSVLFVILSAVVLYVSVIRLNIEVRPPNLVPSTQFTQTFSELSQTNIANMKEIASWGAFNNNLDVVALAQPISGENLFVVYGDGKFRSWDINDQKPVNEYDFISANPIGVNFSADGSWVITPGKIAPDGLNGYNIWETGTGKRVECWGAQCPNGDPDDLRFFDTGILLEPNKKLIVEYISYTVSSTGIQDGVEGVLLSIDNPDDPNKPEILRMGVDNSGKYLSYALADGTVIVRESSHFLGLERGLVKSKEYKYADNNSEMMPIIDLKFDDTRQWLALLSKKELLMWDLTAYFSSEIKIPVESGNAIAFDRAGKVAVVGTDTGMSVINLITRQEMAKYDVGKITALYFTRDNRLLVWCDQKAGIHLWGIFANK
jgi:WD40 repeat protein